SAAGFCLVASYAAVRLAFSSHLTAPLALGYASLAVLGLVLLVVAANAINGFAWMSARFAEIMLSPSPEQRQVWQARRRAEAADRGRRELIVNVSHELRTPIASIQGHAETLLLPEAQRPLDLDRDAYLGVIAGEARRLGGLVDDLLLLARAESGELATRPAAVDLRQVASQVAAALEPLAHAERRVALVRPAEPEAAWAWADSDRVAQVLTNLVRNAITHTPEGGAVMVATGDDGRWAWVSVTDTGVGIAADELARVFERFYRADPSRSRDAGGFGLGLAIARDLVEAMGGVIQATSEPGQGTSFRVMLPRLTI
ncbi:MAG: HAMP domain-containing histidine kinase, partial [Candidatus Dormibacteraeota bacterium]|nr:HAMP domain-containing histidine kinase [Candidatus Dormibacteraeota bacterium]